MSNLYKSLAIFLVSSLVVFIPTQKPIGAHPSTIQATPKPPIPAISQLKEQPQVLLATKSTIKPPETVSMASNTSQNEQITWDFLISKGYTRNQTAGILGNLRQEHNFNTSDVAGGLGIAQWIGNRRENLMARGNYTDIHVQLQFLYDELQAHTIPDNLSGATLTFQNQFERCGDCRQDQRLNYAQDILGKH